MTGEARSDWRIGVAPRERQATALALACSRPDAADAADGAAQAQRLLELADLGTLSLAGLFEARRGDQMCGAVWMQTPSGGAASLWPPRTLAANDDACADALLAAAIAWGRDQGVRLVQALLSTDADRDADRLGRHGFEHGADLLYMVSLMAQFPTAPPAPELKFVSLAECEPARLANLVEHSYEGTLDCPRLNGVRSIDEVLAGYRATGVFDPRRWFVVQQGTSDIGCLLLADHPGDDQLELVYTGLVPSARGAGHGTSIARHAQWLARQAGRQRLVLGVDAENWPAIDMYAAAGFAAWDRRSVFLRILPVVP